MRTYTKQQLWIINEKRKEKQRALQLKEQQQIIAQEKHIQYLDQIEQQYYLDLENWENIPLNQKGDPSIFKYTYPILEKEKDLDYSRKRIIEKYFNNQENEYRLLTIKDLNEEIRKHEYKPYPNRSGLRAMYHILNEAFLRDRDRKIGIMRMTINFKQEYRDFGLEELKKINEKFNLIRSKDEKINNWIIAHIGNYEIGNGMGWNNWHSHYTFLIDNRDLWGNEERKWMFYDKMIDISNYWYRLAGRYYERLMGISSNKDIKKVEEMGRKIISINRSIPYYPEKYIYVDCLDDRNNLIDYCKYHCQMGVNTMLWKRENPDVKLVVGSIR